MFQKKIENFRCGHCHQDVRGNGYTNHCPQCLYSRHVDIYPGDRLAICGGLMEPISLQAHGKKQILVHRCLVCGHEKKNKVDAEDDFEMLLALAKKNDKHC
ncbi:MAG: RNHCP domain-containing protein [Candidatus Moranbacteria bacterium]|nr:RNHCP domain-containing protein [Candidatus Moranbacteria bacterium]